MTQEQRAFKEEIIKDYDSDTDSFLVVPDGSIRFGRCAPGALALVYLNGTEEYKGTTVRWNELTIEQQNTWINQ